MFVKYMLNSHVGNFWEATVANITERLGDFGKWSLIIAPILVVVFNFLIPTNGIAPADPSSPQAYAEALGANAPLANISFVLILLGLALYLVAIFHLVGNAANDTASGWLKLGAAFTIASVPLWGITIAAGLAETNISETLVAAGAEAQAAGQLGQIHGIWISVQQVAMYVGFFALIPIGLGLAGDEKLKFYGWALALVGLVTIILGTIMPVKTETGQLVFGIMALIWGIVVLGIGVRKVMDDLA